MRRITRGLAVAVALTAAAFGMSSPASAAETNWKTVDTNSNWFCTPYLWHKVSRNVNFKDCLVINPTNGSKQTVLVVQNAAGVAVSIDGFVRTGYGSYADCAKSTLSAGATRGCYGSTVANPPANSDMNSELILNGVSETSSEAYWRINS